MINGVMIQYFEWYMNCNQDLWNRISNDAEKLAEMGITAVWLPPAYKGIGGKDEVGYGVYDLYDLGEFNQKGTIKTKYGSKDEYIECIKKLQEQQIQVYADIVLNHKMGADFIQTIPATKVDWGNHQNQVADIETVKVATKFTFPERNDKYSDFKWNWTHFDGIDYNMANGEKSLFKFKDKDWEKSVDGEFENYDYLMGADLDFGNEEVREECKKWGKWYLEFTKVNGFRLDAVKHISAKFYKEWIQYLREQTKKELFTVGEYWSGDVSKLHKYIEKTEGEISLFDVPLHYNFSSASKEENYDLTKIFDNTLLKENPCKAVTFVDNHDTEPGQALESYVERWFKTIAYSIILLRNSGYPCIFYGDLYGIEKYNIQPIEEIKILIKLRKERAYGNQYDYIDNRNCIGWTREGDEEHNQSGLAVLISNSNYAEKRMYIGKKFANKKFIDIMGYIQEEVMIDEEGCGNFKVNGKSVSIWINKE